MRMIVCFLVLVSAFAPLHADWKITTRTGNRSRTECYRGHRIRTDSGGPLVTVLDADRRRQIEWRDDLRQYRVVEWPPLPPTDPTTEAPVIVIERSTTDTGERRTFFGRPARHLVTRVSREGEPPTVIDGWYVEATGLPNGKANPGGVIATLTASSGMGQRPAIPRIELRQTGPVPRGLVVWQKTTSTFPAAGGAQRAMETVSEVTELVEGTLSDRLFEPPDGYRRVENFPAHAPLSWGDLFEAHWHGLVDWVSHIGDARR